jgi:dephospho-CoA kinase
MAERGGARVLDADGIVRELYAGGPIAAGIGAAFGDEVLRSDGSVDRAALARAVFPDAEARQRLEAIVHPAVRGEVLARLDAWRAEGYSGLVVLDAALLVESDFAYPLDALVVVTAPEAARLQRLEARGVPADEARRRMAAQAPDSVKQARADHVVRNDGNLADLERGVDRLLRDLGDGGDAGAGSG